MIYETKTYLKLKNKPQDNFPEWIVVHHSAASENQTVESIENYHLSLGWEGVGYSYLITPNGDIYKGRPEHYHGSHVKEQNINTKSVSICLVGDFDKKMPTEAQKTSLRGILSELKAKYSIPLEKIVPHRYFLGNPPYKTCFGKLLDNNWAKKLLETEEVGSVKDEIKKQIINLLNQL